MEKNITLELDAPAPVILRANDAMLRVLLRNLLDNALRRLHRLAGQEIEGSGLGLSIVARIAALHRARLELTDGIGQPGLAVRIVFRT